MYLGIDLGRKKTGLATSEGLLATPYKIITHKSYKEALQKVIKEIEATKSDTVVLGFVPGKHQKYFENFKKALETSLPDLRIIMWEETMTTRQARQTMIKLHVPQSKKSKKEDTIAASIILQEYLDSHD